MLSTIESHRFPATSHPAELTDQPPVIRSFIGRQKLVSFSQHLKVLLRLELRKLILSQKFQACDCGLLVLGLLLGRLPFPLEHSLGLVNQLFS